MLRLLRFKCGRQVAGLLFTPCPGTEPLAWNDAMIGLESRSLGTEEYCRHLSAVGLSVTSEYEDQGQNLYFDVSQDCLIVDEKASRSGGIDSEGAGVKLCGKSTTDSRRVGA
jgi:hypothetical protein